MRAPIALVAFLAGAGSAALACGGTSSASSADAGGGSAEGEEDEEAEDAGGSGVGDFGGQVDSGTVLPGDCVITSTAFTSGKIAETVARGELPDAARWSDLAGALAEDASFAAVTLDEGEESQFLRVAGFGLTLPSEKTPRGVAVELKVRAPSGGVEDGRVEIELGGGRPSEPRTSTFAWSKTTAVARTYGAASDTWGLALLPADVNAPSFAVRVAIKRVAGSTGPTTVYVSSLRVAVYYCR